MPHVAELRRFDLRRSAFSDEGAYLEFKRFIDHYNDLIDHLRNLSWEPVTPQWISASNPQPNIGNGTLTGYYYEDHHGMAFFQLSLVAGSTTNFGTGAWQFSPPTDLQRDAIGDWYGPVYGLESGVGTPIGVARAGDTTNFIALFGAPAATSSWSPTVPHNWGAGDEIRFSVSYRID